MVSSSELDESSWPDLRLAAGALVVAVICISAGIHQFAVHNILMGIALLIAALLVNVVVVGLGLKHLRRIL